jgi:hypothetical protein
MTREIEECDVGIVAEQGIDVVFKGAAPDERGGVRGGEKAHIEIDRSISMAFQNGFHLMRVIHASEKIGERHIVIDADDQGSSHDGYRLSMKLAMFSHVHATV